MIPTRLPSALAVAALLAIHAPRPVHRRRPPTRSWPQSPSAGPCSPSYDQAAWHATDAVKATHPPTGKIVRYIARQTAIGWTVDFGRLSPDGTKFLTAYEAIQTEAPTHFAVGKFDPEREDTGFNLAAARAIDLALKDFHGANVPYNVAVLPGGPEATSSTCTPPR